MKFRRLNSWTAPQDCGGLIYFSQLLEEMLFVFSLDTYKASVMHTGLLCREASNVIREIELGNVKQPNINHVNAELCSAFEKDSIAQSLVPLPPSAFFPVLKNTRSTLKELQTVLSFLSVQLTSERYRSQAEKFLKEEITGKQSVAEIRRLTRSYVTELVAEGFDQRYIQKSAFEYFYGGKNIISTPSDIQGFFELFPANPRTFNVYFRVDAIFEHLGEELSPLGLKISRSIPDDIDVTRFQRFAAQSENTLYAIAETVSARDNYSARDDAEHRLKLCSTLLNLFHHKENPSWRPDCLVQNTENKLIEQISNPINAMHKCADMKPEIASAKMKSLFQEFSLENTSFVKFVRSAQLHSMALASNSYENQILNLWIALESLIPTETRIDETSNIEHIVDSIVPFLNTNYIENLLYNHVKDLMRWNYKLTRAALNGIDGKKLSEKLVKLMICTEFSSQRTTLEASFRDFHLLRDRFEFLRTLASSPKSIVDALDSHQTRLAWQIRRIYRTRNIIVHSGKTPSYTKALIEHTHDYLDTVLLQLVKLASKPKTINSVAQGFKFMEMKYKQFHIALSAKDIVFTRDNVGLLLISK